MRVRTAIKIVFVLVVALAVAGAAILFNLDPNDLGTETFKMKIEPRLRGFDLSLAVPVLVRGPLDDPSFLPDPLGALAKIGSLLGSIVFPPAALIRLVDLGVNNHPCIQYAKTTEGQSAPTPLAPLESRQAGLGTNRRPTGNTD
jgi:hypothetical protein